jgi:hypothetical protein
MQQVLEVAMSGGDLRVAGGVKAAEIREVQWLEVVEI